ncbi:uncharacterized protein LOC104893369 [Beta vulgaris subsp. vulgaris]|uniref:uncharacterized protein LOC104893369 n=1 Tax=Beta vulgaris subsp. vulgaris TaxID=3555 RepID=UPI00053F7457|nr:uncharacterized protein LOC104893369 [Beta vulgaris subsp. vulgaris]
MTVFPRRDRLEKSHVFLPQQCVLCTSQCETSTHLFFLCPFTIDVFLHWQASKGWPCLPVLANISASSSFKDTLYLLKGYLSQKDLAKVATTWWFIWFFRNKTIFNEESVSSRRASFAISEFFSNGSRPKPKEVAGWGGHKCGPRRGPGCCWSPPPTDVVKINFDGSKLSTGQASLGFVVRDHLGEVILAGSNALGCCTSILQAEAWGMLEAVRGSHSLNLSNVMIEGDNLKVINAVNKIWHIPWEIDNINCDVGKELLKFNSVSVKHCFREANRAADFMAHQSHTVPSLCYSFPPYDMDFSLLIRKDVLG